MEHPVTVLRQRATTFNPEAAAFNPRFSSPTLFNAEPGSTTTAVIPRSAYPMAPIFNHSPFDGTGGRHSYYRRDPLTPAPVRLEDFFSPEVQALVKELEEHPHAQEIRAPYTPGSRPVQATESVTESVPFPPFAVPREQPLPNYTAVDINELGVGLGLPTAKANINDGVSTTGSHNSRASQARPGALYGKLIGWALDKPLSAKGLAEFLQKQDTNTPLEAHASAPTNPNAVIVHRNTDSSGTQPTPRSTLKAETSPRDRISAPVPTNTVSPAKGTSAFQHERQHQHRRSSASSASYHHHARVPSNRRFPRRTSRTKRLDQGPMPSAADIYPDDAHWSTPAPIHEMHDYVSYHQELVEQSRMIVGNPFNWPLPAQVYKPEDEPTVADFNAADIDVLALMSELPEPSLDVLARLGNSQDLRISTAFALSCDERPLTPAQEDGSRYGMRFNGLAYGDQWNPSQVGNFDDGKPFRVRPRDHEGWGGREWAMRNVWNA